MTNRRRRAEIRPTIYKDSEAERALMEIAGLSMTKSEAISRLLESLGQEYAGIVAKAKAEHLNTRQLLADYINAGRKAIGLEGEIERPIIIKAKDQSQDEEAERLINYLLGKEKKEDAEALGNASKELKALYIGAKQAEELQFTAYYLKSLFGGSQEGEPIRLKTIASESKNTTARLWKTMSDNLGKNANASPRIADYYIYHGKAYESREEAEEAEGLEKLADKWGLLINYKPYKAGITNLQGILEGYIKIEKVDMKERRRKK